MLRLPIGEVNLSFLAQVPPECRGWRAVALLPFGSWQGNSGVGEVGRGHTPGPSGAGLAPELKEVAQGLTRQVLNIYKGWDPTTS